MASHIHSKFETVPFDDQNFSTKNNDDDAEMIQSSTPTTQVCGLYSETHHDRCSRIEGVVLAILKPESKDNRVQRLMNNQEHRIAVERGGGGRPCVVQEWPKFSPIIHLNIRANLCNNCK